MEIRPASPEEYGAVGDLTVAAYAALGHDTRDVGYDVELRDVAGRIETGDVVLVAVEGDAIVGGVTYVRDHSSPSAEFDEGEVGIRMLAVDPAAQGRGVGTALSLACIDLARADGARVVALHSTPWMTAAHRLYERLGFRRAPDRDFTPLPSVPLLAFVLALDEGV